MLTLFPDEQIITESNNKSVILTTHRICYEQKELGRSYNQNIMLEHITSCENYNSTQVWLLILSAFAAVVGFAAAFQSQGGAFAMALLVSLILFLLYWFSRKNLVIVASPSTKMRIYVTGMKRENVLEFINKIEQTKHKRILNLNSRSGILSS